MKPRETEDIIDISVSSVGTLDCSDFEQSNSDSENVAEERMVGMSNKVHGWNNNKSTFIFLHFAFYFTKICSQTH